MAFGWFSSDKEKGQNPLFVRSFGLFCPSLDLIVGGGGGNRTRVREASTRNIYRLMPSMILSGRVALDQASSRQFVLSSHALSDGHHRAPARLILSDPGGQQAKPAPSRRSQLSCVSVIVIVANYFCAAFYEASGASACSPDFHIPVETSAPP